MPVKCNILFCIHSWSVFLRRTKHLEGLSHPNVIQGDLRVLISMKISLGAFICLIWLIQGIILGSFWAGCFLSRTYQGAFGTPGVDSYIDLPLLLMIIKLFQSGSGNCQVPNNIIESQAVQWEIEISSGNADKLNRISWVRIHPGEGSTVKPVLLGSLD